jgi:hypothetical protein
MKFHFLATLCLSYHLPQDETPSIPQQIGHSIGNTLDKTWNFTKYLGAKVSRGTKIATHKVLTGVEKSAKYVDKKVVLSIKPVRPVEKVQVV